MSTQVVINNQLNPPGLRRRSMLARGTTGVTRGVTGAMGGGLKGAAKGAAVGGLVGTGLAPLTFGASVPIGAAIGGAAGGALGAVKGGVKGAAHGIRKFKKAPSVESQTYNSKFGALKEGIKRAKVMADYKALEFTTKYPNAKRLAAGAAIGGSLGAAAGYAGKKAREKKKERVNNMQTVCYVNNSEQRRVQTQMTLNRLNASMEPIEMVTENSIGRAMKVGKVMAQRGAMKAGRKIKPKVASASKGLQRAAQYGAAKAEDAGRKIGSHVKKHKTAYQTAGAAAGGGYVGYKLKKARGH